MVTEGARHVMTFETLPEGAKPVGCRELATDEVISVMRIGAHIMYAINYYDGRFNGCRQDWQPLKGIIFKIKEQI